MVIMMRRVMPSGPEGEPTLSERLSHIENLLVVLVERQQVKDWYDIDEFARLSGKAPFTVREWARYGRIRAEKRKSGRGAYAAWVISHAELLRYQREGLLPLNPGRQ
jgi:hypothetical protein